MEAHNRPIRLWMKGIRSGSIRLPAFQRGEVWRHYLVSDFLEAVIQDKPLGSFLVLDVNPSDPPFDTDPIAGVENDKDKCNEHLLDGQQRLAALWRSFNNEHKDGRVFYVRWDDTVEGLKRGAQNKWIGNPQEEFKHEQQYIPIAILEPSEIGLARSYQWKQEATQNPKESEKLSNRVEMLRDKFADTDIPCLSMPMRTSANEAIETFVKVNTSSMRLTGFDIAVAVYMSQNKSELFDLVEDVKKDIPGILALEEEETRIGDLILKAACVQQGIKPTNTYIDLKNPHRGLNLTELKKEWKTLRNGIEWTSQIFKEEHIYHDRLLPSAIPLRVLPALHKHFEAKKRDKRSRARSLIRSYLWRAFTTDWYSRDANSRLFKDFSALKAAIENESFEVPLSSTGKMETIFDEDVVTMDDLLQAGWPTRRGTLSRAVLAISVRQGARDLEENEVISVENMHDREYHHIFPKRLLRDYAQGSEQNLALNCMLLKKATNLAWRDEWPGDYIEDRRNRSGSEGEEAVRIIEERLASHFVASQTITKAKESDKSSLGDLYNKFLKERAGLILEAIKKLCDGEDL